jgi:transcriptional regulator with XRE-family HTH domain
MDSEKNKEIERLNQIIISTTLSRAGFSDLIGISRQLLNKYLNGDNDIQKITKKIFEVGFSIDWFYSGKGKMHLDSEDEFEYDILNDYSIETQNNNIMKWITLVYGTIDNFNNSTNINYKDLTERFKKGLPITYEHYCELKRLGCNMRWTITNEGSMFSINNNGKKLKKNYKQNLLEK